MLTRSGEDVNTIVQSGEYERRGLPRIYVCQHTTPPCMRKYGMGWCNGASLALHASEPTPFACCTYVHALRAIELDPFACARGPLPVGAPFELPNSASVLFSSAGY
jgi:hypothetical protein